MLDRQYHLFSVDTGNFYTNREKYLHEMNCRYRAERNYIQNKLPEIEKKLKQCGYTEETLHLLRKEDAENVPPAAPCADTVNTYLHWIRLIRHKREKAKASKEKLITLLSNKVRQNELTGGRDHTRTLRTDALSDTNIISAFDSALSRAIGIGQDELTDA
ncbi:MAG: hypothetical protein K2I53_06775, partial [Lachnospiraceae bacterium]|nr:hypothetical protein [Lachnospiraceae bacterium]